LFKPTACGARRNLDFGVSKRELFEIKVLTNDVVFLSRCNQLVVVRQKLSRGLGHKYMDAALNGVDGDGVMGRWNRIRTATSKGKEQLAIGREYNGSIAWRQFVDRSLVCE
jgi:hypothetical protein